MGVVVVVMMMMMWWRKIVVVIVIVGRPFLFLRSVRSLQLVGYFVVWRILLRLAVEDGKRVR